MFTYGPRREITEYTSVNIFYAIDFNRWEDDGDTAGSENSGYYFTFRPTYRFAGIKVGSAYYGRDPQIFQMFYREPGVKQFGKPVEFKQPRLRDSKLSIIAEFIILLKTIYDILR